jgi:hypothetical protein
MTPVKFSSNDGIILDNERFYQGQKFKSNKMGYSYERNENLYGAISILLENDEEIYFRNYKKLQSIIGYIGGFYQFFLLLFKLINSFIYYDFQIVDDFNKMIENRISKYFHKQYSSKIDESLSNLYKRSKSNVLDKNKYNNNKIINNFINQSKNNNSIYQLRSQESIYEKLSKNYRKVSWRNLIFYKCICSKSFNVGYMDIIIKKRSKLLSEESIFKMNITLKLLYENHIDKKSILIPKK